jgi:lysophospholipase L1-like esterase
MKIAPRSKLLFIGDSITDCNRTKPVGEGLFGALGTGYVSLVDATFGAVCPERRIRIVNMGTSGNTVRDLKARWETDVLAQNPDWLSIMIGINDVWRQFDLPLKIETHVSPKEYAATLAELVAQTAPTLKGLVLMTPYYIEPNRKDAMRARMDEYGAIVKALGRRQAAICVDTQAAFDKVLRTTYPATLAWDRVHPTPTGHMVLARAFLAGIGFKG